MHDSINVFNNNIYYNDIVSGLMCITAGRHMCDYQGFRKDRKGKESSSLNNRRKRLIGFTTLFLEDVLHQELINPYSIACVIPDLVFDLFCTLM